MFFHQIFMNINDFIDIDNIIINVKIVVIPFNIFYLIPFKLLAVKSFEIFSKHNGHDFIS